MFDTENLSRADRDMNARRAAELALWVLRADGSAERAASAGAPRHVVKMMRAQIMGVRKAAESALSSESASALADIRHATDGLMGSTGSVGLFDDLRADAVPGEPNVQYAVGLSDPLAGGVTEGGAIRIGRMLFDSRILREQQTGCIVVLTKELLRHASALVIIEQAMRRGIARATDALVVQQLIVGAPTVAASGNDATAAFTDIRRALGLIPSGADARFRAAVGVELAKRMALQTTATGARAHPEMTPVGGRLGGIPCSVSEALTTDAIITDGSAIVTTASEIEVESSNSGAIEMDSTPTMASADESSPAQPVATMTTSLFQAGAIALKVKRFWDWAPIRPVHTAVISGAGTAWGLDNGSPPQ